MTKGTFQKYRATAVRINHCVLSERCKQALAAGSVGVSFHQSYSLMVPHLSDSSSNYFQICAIGSHEMPQVILFKEIPSVDFLPFKFYLKIRCKNAA